MGCMAADLFQPLLPPWQDAASRQVSVSLDKTGSLGADLTKSGTRRTNMHEVYRSLSVRKGEIETCLAGNGLRHLSLDQAVPKHLF